MLDGVPSLRQLDLQAPPLLLLHLLLHSEGLQLGQDHTLPYHTVALGGWRDGWVDVWWMFGGCWVDGWMIDG